MTRPTPRQPAPPLELSLTDGSRWSLAGACEAHDYVLVEFYRGRHCGICATHLAELNGLADRLDALNTAVVAVSMNSPKLAADAQIAWGIDRIPVAHGLTADQARAWGLYLSAAFRDTEPDLFAEPATFLVDRAGDIYMAAIHSSPHLRLQWPRVIRAIERAHEGYPARGEA